MVTWTPEQVIFAIRIRLHYSAPMDVDRAKGIDSHLYEAACEYFGTWELAIEVAQGTDLNTL